jgi:hypothetical protein
LENRPIQYYSVLINNILHYKDDNGELRSKTINEKLIKETKLSHYFDIKFYHLAIRIQKEGPK